jgi:hypothetical protein
VSPFAAGMLCRKHLLITNEKSLLITHIRWSGVDPVGYLSRHR